MHLDIGAAVLLHISAKASHRRRDGAAASVSYTVENFGDIQAVSFVFFELIRYNLTLAQVTENSNIVVHFNACKNIIAVNTVPFADVKGLTVSAAPGELLRCKAVEI